MRRSPIQHVGSFSQFLRLKEEGTELSNLHSGRIWQMHLTYNGTIKTTNSEAPGASWINQGWVHLVLEMNLVFLPPPTSLQFDPKCSTDTPHTLFTSIELPLPLFNHQHEAYPITWWREKDTLCSSAVFNWPNTYFGPSLGDQSVPPSINTPA